MNPNPILTVFKIIAFTILAVFVGLTFFQRTELEDKVVALEKRNASLNDGVSRALRDIRDLKGRMEAQGAMDEGLVRAMQDVREIKRMLASGAVINTDPGTGGTAPPEEDAFDPTTALLLGDPEEYAWGDEAPPWVTGTARELWGQLGWNFLQPDPELPEYADMDDPAVDPEGEIELYYGSSSKDLNPLTLSDGTFTQRVRDYCEDYMGHPHAQNPYNYRPGLAYRVEVSEDYTRWVYWMRPGVQWHPAFVDLDKYPFLKGRHEVTAHGLGVHVQDDHG